MSDSRLFNILYYLLDKGRATAPELAAKFEVSPRTIYRDVEALSGAGIPVYAEPGRNGGISLLPGFTLDKAILSAHEQQEILAAVQSISATGYSSGEETLTKLSALFHVDMGNWLEVDFSRWGKSKGQQSARTIQPLKLSYQSKEWYLKAFCLKRQDFRIFKLNRILRLKLSAKTFVPKPYPEPEEDCPPPFPQIVLLFPKEMAYRVYDEFDQTQIQTQENGSLIATAQMPVDPWLMGYLLSFGTQVEILEPAYLKEALAEQALKIYQKNKP